MAQFLSSSSGYAGEGGTGDLDNRNGVCGEN